MISRRSILSWVAAQLFLFIALPAVVLAQNTVDNPTGPTGVYNGNITTAGNYDPATGNQMRIVDDLVVPGSMGAYPLKWTRYFNTNVQDGQWTFAYKDYRLTDTSAYLPDGRHIPASGMPDYPVFETRLCPNGYYCQVGVFHLADGGQVEFDSEFVEGVSNSYTVYRPNKLIDPYGQVTTLTYATRGYYDTRAGAPPAPIYVLDKVTEPGGRYLQLTWQDAPSCSAGTTVVQFRNVISKVEAFDGQGNSLGSVSYTWISMKALNDICVPLLDTITYSDGTTAHYTYVKGTMHLGGGSHVNDPVMLTADDVRYDGAMRRIAYGLFDTSGNLTFAPAAESNLNTHELLTEAGFDSNDDQSTPDYQHVITYVREKEIRADGPTRTFTYNERCHWDNPAGETVECDDNNKGKLIAYTDFLGNSTEITYYDEATLPYFSGAGYIQSVKDPNGHTTTYVRGDSQQPTWNITQIQYPDGSTMEQAYTDNQAPYYLASRTLQHGPSDPVRTITYTRNAPTDPNPHAIRRKNYPDGGWEEFDYNGLGEVTAHRRCKDGTTVETESFQYDGRGLKLHYTDAAGGITDYVYYTSGPWSDRLQTVTYPANVSGLRASETYEYDRAYDANGQNSGAPSGSLIAGRGLVTRITHADGNYKSFGYNKYGDKLWEEDELRQRTTYTYDEYGRVLTATTPLSHTTTNSYVPTGKTSSTITTSKLPFTTTLPSGKQSTFEYDANWRKTAVHVAPNTVDAATTQYRYDEGNANIGHLTTMVDPKNNSTTYGYDSRDRQTSVTDAFGHTSSVIYDTRGVKISETKPNGELTTYDLYDAMNRLLKKTVHNDTGDEVTDYSYDCAGNLQTQIFENNDNNSGTYVYSYDNVNRQTMMTYPNNRTEVHEYDQAGNVKKYTNRTGAFQTFTYDNRNRQTGFSWSDATSSQTAAYDAASRKTEIDNADATIALGYDAENHLISQTGKEVTAGVGDNVARTVSYTYDADGNRASITYPGGTVLNYDYTQRNQVMDIKANGQPNPLVAYLFDANGNITSRTLDNGTSTAFMVDQVNRDTSIIHALSGGPRRFDYAYNSVNDITAAQRDGGMGDGYNYDLDQQITEFQQNGTVNLSAGTVSNPAADKTMRFDHCGNRTNLNNVSESFNNMNQPNDVPHDTNGNVQSYNGWSYTYDAQNRLRSASSAASTVSFYYDGLNRQVARVTSGGASTPTPTPTPTLPPLPTITPTPTLPPLPTITPTPTIPPIGTPTPTPTPTSAPKCSPVNISQSFNSQSGHYFVSMSCPSPTPATIFYTTDGSAPTHTGGTATGTTQTYGSQIDIGNCGDHLFNAIAYKSGWLDSDVSSQDYNHGTCGGGGMMMSSSQSTAVVFSVWDGDWALLEEYDQNGNRVEGYVQGYHGLVKTLFANVYYYQDELGSTSHIARSNGTLIESYQYNLYGLPQVYDTTGALKPGATPVAQDLGNGGARWMPALGLYDDRNRFMSPDLGRFLQPDPIGFKGDASNLYRYCGNDWANKADPMGLESPSQVDSNPELRGDNHTMQISVSKMEQQSQVNVDAHHVENVQFARAEAKEAARATIHDPQMRDAFGKMQNYDASSDRAGLIDHKAREAQTELQRHPREPGEVTEVSTYVSQKNDGSQNYLGHPLTLNYGKLHGMNASRMFDKNHGGKDPSPQGYHVVAGIVAQRIYAPHMSRRDQGVFRNIGYDGYTVTPGDHNHPNGIQINPYHYADEPR